MVRVAPEIDTPRAALFWRVVLRVVTPLVLVALAAGLGLAHLPLYGYWRAARDYPFQLDAEEGFLVNQALRLTRGETIYPALEQGPLTVGNYPPLFPLACAALQAGAEPYDWITRDRALVQAATHFAALMLLLIVAVRTRSLLAALLAPLLFLTTFEVYRWSAYVRVDLPALALTLAGLLAFAATRARWGAVLAGVLFTAAIYTRQTAILAPAACLLALAWNDRRRIPWLLVPMLVLGLGAFALLQALTHGEFWRHTVVYNANVMNWAALRAVLQHEIWFFYRWWILALAGGLAAGAGVLALRRAPQGEVERDGFYSPGTASPVTVSATLPDDYAEPELPADAESTPRDPARGVFAIYGLLAALSMTTAAKAGAAENYFLEPLAAAALGMGLLVAWLARAADVRDEGEPAARRGKRLVALAGLLLMLALLARHVAWVSMSGEGRGVRPQMFSAGVPGDVDRASAGEIARIVLGAADPVLSEEPVFTLLARREAEFQPFIMSQLAREGLWDEAPFVARLRAGDFSLLLVTEDLISASETGTARYTPAMIAAIRERYHPADAVALPGVRKVYYTWTREPQEAPVAPESE